MTGKAPQTVPGSGSTGEPVHRLLEQRLNYTFQNPDLLERALTHSSSVNRRQQSNERLEFLGDRVLGLVIADMLLAAFPNEDEGALGYRFAALVRLEALERVAEPLGLEGLIKRETDPAEAGARQKSSLLGNACEAVIAAIYLDGGLDAARRFIQHHWTDLLKQDIQPPKDPKTRLQEYAQSQGWPLPQYQIIRQTGPDHAPEFVVEVLVRKTPPAQGSGPSKRAAEMAAAEALLQQINGNTSNG